MDTARPTLLRVLLEQRGWATYAAFEPRFDRAAREAAREFGNPRLRSLNVASITFKRWLAGEQLPRDDAATVLEQLLGVEAKLLMQPVPRPEIVPARVPHDASLAAARRLDTAWANSLLVPASPAPGVSGVWHLDGIGLFDGTSVPVQMYEAEQQGDVAVIGAEDLPHVRSFVRPSRRALLLASLGVSGGRALAVLDAGHARAQLARQPTEALAVPAVYELDDLTFGVLWACLNVDDGLSADDAVLDAEGAAVERHLSAPRSAIARSAVPELSEVGAAWLGSHFCARHIGRQLADVAGAPLFWSREQRGEEAAGWVFFRHKHEYLRTQADKIGAEGSGRAFCIPPAAVKGSERYERVVLFLALAMMERHGMTLWVCAEPDYAQVDGVVLLPERRAIVANWLRSDAVWHVDTVERRPVLRGYEQAFGHARAHSVIDGPDPATRLRRLADYLALDWTWLTARCRRLGEYGAAGMLRARSRLVSLQELDRTLAFVGDLGEL